MGYQLFSAGPARVLRTRPSQDFRLRRSLRDRQPREFKRELSPEACLPSQTNPGRFWKRFFAIAAIAIVPSTFTSVGCLA